MRLSHYFLAPAAALAVLIALAAPSLADDQPKPVLMVIANQDFYHQEYYETRESLEAAGLEVVVAAATTETATPHANVQPDIALTDVVADDYSAIVFSGGWGMAQYQYGFEGTYHNSAYRGERSADVVNDLINDFVEQDKVVAAVCYGVSVLAYARVDGESLLEGRTVTGWNGSAPGFDLDRQSYPERTVPARWQIESQGANMLLSGAIGDPQTATDDVWIDGNIITAENYDSAYAFGKVLLLEIVAR